MQGKINDLTLIGKTINVYDPNTKSWTFKVLKEYLPDGRVLCYENGREDEEFLKTLNLFRVYSIYRSCTEWRPATINLAGYKPKGQLSDVPKPIIDKMLHYQNKQGNAIDITVFESNMIADYDDGGFNWDETEEGYDFWDNILVKKDYNSFFSIYSNDNPSYLNPFDKCLVRDREDDYWIAAIFSHVKIDENNNAFYYASGLRYEQCIPYEHNEYLLGTKEKI